MTVSRRKFLKLVTTAIGGGLIGYGAFQYLAVRFPQQSSLVNNWLTEPTLAAAPTGRLHEAVLHTLLATVRAVIDQPVATEHYAAYFTWYAENRPGYKTLYEAFFQTVNRAARAVSGCGFDDCHLATQRQLLERAFTVRAETGRVARLRIGVLNRQWLRYDRFIVQEILVLFARTDALLVLGYEAWPGTPRGLENYTSPPGL